MSVAAPKSGYLGKKVGLGKPRKTRCAASRSGPAGVSSGARILTQLCSLVKQARGTTSLDVTVHLCEK